MSIDWKTDYELTLAQARKLRRLVVVHFWLEGRPLVRAMNEETFSDEVVIRLSTERFLNVRIDLKARPELFEKTIGGRGGLGTCIVDASGDVVSALPGYAGPQRYLEFLKGADSGYPRLLAARRTLAQTPKSIAALHALAETYHSLGSARRADEHYERVSRTPLLPGDPNTKYLAYAHERLARSRALRGKNREASVHVAEYRKLDPANRFGRLDRIILTEGILAWIDRRLADSIRLLEDALRQFPASQERSEMMVALAVARHETGDDAGALSLLDRVLREKASPALVARATEQIAHIKNPPADHVH